MGKGVYGDQMGQGKVTAFWNSDSGTRRVLVAIRRQCSYKLLNRESNVSLRLHQRPWGNLDPVSQKCKKFAVYGCCLLGLRENDRESDRKAPGMDTAMARNLHRLSTAEGVDPATTCGQV